MAWLAGLYVCIICGVLAVGWALLPEERATPLLPGRLQNVEAVRRRSLLPLFGVFRAVGRLFPRPTVDQEQEETRLLYAGSSLNGVEFHGLGVLAGLAGCVVMAVVLREFAVGWMAPAWVLLGGVIGWSLPRLWLRSRIARRHHAILRLLPDAVDLLTLCVGAGLDFVTAVHRVVAARPYQGEALVEEFSLALQEMQFGKRRADAFQNMAKRVQLSELTSFVRTLNQAERMGTPISEVLSAYAEDVRLQRFVRAERQALKAPIKILLPLIFCIMPCVAIIVAAPVFIEFIMLNPFQQMK